VLCNFFLFLLKTPQLTRRQAVQMWHYFNGDQDKDTDDDGDESFDDDASSTEIRGCQSDSDEEAQRNPYPFGYR